MSSADDQGGPGNREVAYRLFASEFDDADFSYSESDEERAPNYVVTPTGARVNRLFVVGVLTEIETVSEDYLRARVVDPTGPFVVYAGQYQPDALAFLERAAPPVFVAVTGKARTFQPDDADQVYTSIRPEAISEVDAKTRDRWVVQTAERTLDRVARMAEAKQSGYTGDDLRAALRAHGVDESLAAGIPIALDRYGTTGDYLAGTRNLALDGARVVAGERDEVESLALAPDQGSDDVAALVEAPIETTVESSETDQTTADQVADTASADGQRAGTAEASTASESGSSSDPVSTETSPAASDQESADTDDDLGDFDPEFELDDEEREEIESEYGTDFQSGTDVDEPGEAGIETPDPDASETDATTEEAADSESRDQSPADAEANEADTDEADADEDVDLDDAVMAAMSELDDGDGADRETVIETVVDRTGSGSDAVEDAIQEALMGGQCYEPSDGTLKTI
ncbi:hypothetical protein BRC91_10930 [Halobacteriales archaeon QS_4_62_28]|nr:MAG: hypothetical protein BRC91_10930 [Halobacteriales archaeon QS_4_62_28]